MLTQSEVEYHDRVMAERDARRRKNKTYRDVYNEFVETTGIQDVWDWRPAAPPYWHDAISDAILIWNKDGSRMIYISKDNKED